MLKNCYIIGYVSEFVLLKMDMNWSVEQKKIMDHFDNFLIQTPVKSGPSAASFGQLVLADNSLKH